MRPEHNLIWTHYQCQTVILKRQLMASILLMPSLSAAGTILNCCPWRSESYQRRYAEMPRFPTWLLSLTSDFHDLKLALNFLLGTDPTDSISGRRPHIYRYNWTAISDFNYPQVDGRVRIHIKLNNCAERTTDWLTFQFQSHLWQSCRTMWDVIWQWTTALSDDATLTTYRVAYLPTKKNIQTILC